MPRAPRSLPCPTAGSRADLSHRRSCSPRNPARRTEHLDLLDSGVRPRRRRIPADSQPHMYSPLPNRGYLSSREGRRPHSGTARLLLRDYAYVPTWHRLLSRSIELPSIELPAPCLRRNRPGEIVVSLQGALNGSLT